MADASSDFAVILFDGECHFCSAWVAFVIRHDARGRFRFAPRQSDAARRLLAPFGVAPDALGSIALMADSTLVTRSDAVLRIFTQLRLPWRVMAWLAVVPRPLRDVVYASVARNRHRLSWRRKRCRLLQAGDGDRFLR